MKIKICNCKTLIEAKMLARNGVDFIGLHLVTERDIERMLEYKLIIMFLREYYPGVRSVLVTKELNIEKLEKILNEFEFDGLQLHYKNAVNNFKLIKVKFKDILTFQVVSEDFNSRDLFNEVDYCIVDKSYMGGTGRILEKDQLEIFTEMLKGRKVFIAGGVNIQTIKDYDDYNIEGFDIQSGVRDVSKKIISWNKLSEILKYIKKVKPRIVGDVSYSVKSVHDIPEVATGEFFYIDSFHLDVSDGFVSVGMGVNEAMNICKIIEDQFSGLVVQFHVFTNSSAFIEDFKTKIISYDFEKIISLHLKPSNLNIVNDVKCDNFALDTKDIVDDKFEWARYINHRVLLCVQDSSKDNRIENFMFAFKKIRFANEGATIVIDRGVDLALLDKVLEFAFKNVGIVSGVLIKNDLYGSSRIIKKIINYEK